MTTIPVLLLLIQLVLPSSYGLASSHTIGRKLPTMRFSSPVSCAGVDVDEALLIDDEGQQVELATERRLWRRSIRKEVVAFCLPALSTVLADPLMSVVDSLCVGRTCTLQLASLGPALAVFNFCNYFFFFLNAATCVLVTQALADDQRDQASETLSTAVALALGSGIFTGAVLNLFAEELVTATGCVSELVRSAARYLQIRGLGQPVVLASMTLQSGLLAQKDVLTPLQAICTACVLNVIGDLTLVPKLGAAGAAWATLLAQLVSLPLMLTLSGRRKRLPVRVPVDKLFPLKGGRKFFSTAAPLFLFEMGMSICYMLIESLATQFTVSSTAAFQALWAPLSVLGFFTYPLKQSAQVFLPRVDKEAGGKRIGGRLKTKEFFKVLVFITLQTGGVLSMTAYSLARSPQLFTLDRELFPLIKSFAPYVAVLLPLFGITQTCEGFLVGVDDLKFLSLMQIANVLATSACLLFTRGNSALGIHSTWIVYLTFVLSRLLQSSSRIFFFHGDEDR